MLNEWQEFLDYTGIVAYTAKSKNDISYMGRFTFTTILEFKGLARVLTIIARGYMFHDADGNVLEGDPRERLDYVHKVLCAWCSVPDSKKAAPEKARPHKSQFEELQESFPELVGADGSGWFHRHVHCLVCFVLNNPDKVRKTVIPKAEVIEKSFDAAWRNKVIQFQVPLFSENTKGAWTLRFDDIIADALELGPLQNAERELPLEYLEKLRAVTPKVIPLEVIRALVLYYMAHRQDDTDWVVLPTTNFEVYFGTAFGRKYLPALPKEVFERGDSGYGIGRYLVKADYAPNLR